MSIEVPADILDVAVVVLGEEQRPLTGWQRHAAISAMTALGYSKTHIAWALCTTRASIENFGYVNGITLHRYDQRPDPIAVDMVVTGKARLPLVGADRDEAIRILAGQGLHACAIAARIRVEHPTVIKTAQNLGVTLPEAPTETWSWVAYARGHHRHADDHGYQPPDMATVLARAAQLKQEVAEREDYLYQINRCEHRREWRQAGGLCGGCGKDNFAEIEEAA